MRITHLSLAQFRSYAHFSTDITDNVTVIVGPNGSGKTNLLESIYLLATGTSFRGPDRDVILHQQLQAAAKITLEGNIERSVKLQLRDDGRIAKQFSIDGTKRQRLSFAQRLPVVLFDPDSLRALSSSPARRRAFLDTMLSRLQPHYSTILHRYERTLLQRNELLKRQSTMSASDWQDQLFVWDMKLAELATKIVDYRIDLLAKCNQLLSDTYSEIAERPTTIRAHYESTTAASHYQQAILAKLQQNSKLDALRGYTSVGPHRDDFVVWINDHPAIDVASRGEMRTIMLAFKLVETKFITDTYDTQPLLLLDDVFSELDSIRRAKLIASIKNCQAIITTTDADVSINTITHGVIDLKQPS
jgi:DNA replication and repair protein RecF